MAEHRGIYPYPTRPGLYADIPSWRGGLLEVRDLALLGVSHRRRRNIRKSTPPVVYCWDGDWWYWGGGIFHWGLFPHYEEWTP